MYNIFLEIDKVKRCPFKGTVPMTRCCIPKCTILHFFSDRVSVRYKVITVRSKVVTVNYEVASSTSPSSNCLDPLSVISCMLFV